MAKRSKRAVSPGGLSPLWLLVVSVLLVAAAVGLWLSNSAGRANPVTQGAPPRLAVDRDRIDLGVQPFESPVRAEFKLTNAGDQTLTLNTSTPVRAVEGC